ncbi:MAG TPA: hypothetical protein VFR58_02970 [Flavisolibacter sp.]|nr:hypothetical protein [Flavisolibacter sp.]
MKKWVVYTGFAAGILLLVLLVFTGNRQADRRFNERITLRRTDKIPYGTAVARSLLPVLYPSSSIHYDNQVPGNWDSIDFTSYNQAVILMALDFEAGEDEINNLIFFAKQGNFVFIVARSFSVDARRIFNFASSGNVFNARGDDSQDSIHVRLSGPGFTDRQLFAYPGKDYGSRLYFSDTARTRKLGTDGEGDVNFIGFKTGNGGIFIHTSPLAFSNYFILHKNNIRYFQQVMSVIPSTVDRVLWNDYYLERPQEKPRDQNWFRVLLSYPAFKWGLLTGCIMLVLYVLLNSRRRQRMIPPYARPSNDSLDFIKTLGRLYHDRGDHANLARKMAVYFLEHVRSVYQLPTQELDEQFISALSYKSGYPRKELEELVSFIRYLKNSAAVKEEQLSAFHRQLELFYQNT